MMKHISIKSISLVLVVMLCIVRATTAALATDSTGTPDTDWYTADTSKDAYTISTADELAGLASLVNGGNSFSGVTITLGDDIDLSVYTDWTPIGIYDPTNRIYMPFSGTFDGAGYTISGLSISTTARYQGLFTFINPGGTVQNVTVEGKVSGGSDVGGIVGYNNYGTVTNCINSCAVSGSGRVGGIVGENVDGTVSGCTNTGAVSGESGVGGIAGDNTGDYGTVSGCTNTGAVSGESNVGGIVGNNTGTGGTVSGCANTGAVSGESSVGGIVGYNLSAVSGCTNIGTVSGNDEVGGIAGFNESDESSVTNCYYYNDTAGTGVGTGDDSGVTEKDSEAFASGEVCYLLNGGVLNEDGSIQTVATANGTQMWYQNLDNGETVDSYPVLDSTHGTVYYGTSDGTTYTYSNFELYHVYDADGFCGACGSYQPATQNSDGVYEITNTGQLFWFASLVNGDTTQEGITAAVPDACAVLTDSIDLSVTTTTHTDTEWTPIGTDSAPYTGTFDGGGFEISGLNITIAADYVGLFGYVTGTVRNLTVRGEINVSGNTMCVGGIVGTVKNGTLQGLTSYVNVTGYDGEKGIFGGVVAKAEGDNGTVGSAVERCAYYGTVKASGVLDCVGGIAGYMNAATITNCINNGTVDTTGGTKAASEGIYTGGIVSYINNAKAVVTNCVNVGEVSGVSDTSITSYTGAIVGRIKQNVQEVSNCYYLTDANSTPDGVAANGSSVTAETSAQTAEEFATGAAAWSLQNANTDDVWGQDLTSDAYPVLTSETTIQVVKVTFYKSPTGIVLMESYTNINGTLSSYLTGSDYTFYSDFDLTDEISNIGAETFDTDTNIYVVIDHDLTILETNGGTILEGTDYTYDDNLLIVLTGGTYTISGTSSTDTIVIASNDDVAITLYGVNITSDSKPPMEITGSGTVTVKLSDENTLKATGEYCAGLQKTSTDNELIITSADGDGKTAGSLTATGGFYGAGIGGGAYYDADTIRWCGSDGSNIIISGGKVDANSGGNGAGIGGGGDDGGIYGNGTVTINGGMITAGSGTGAGIGGGEGGSGTVTISGGTINANSTGGAGIGGGEGGSGTVTISGGTITAGSGTGAGIGGGEGGSGTVTISGGTVTANSSHAAGIGTGSFSTGTTTVAISGGYITISNKGSNSDYIGSGDYSTGTNTVTITGGYFADNSYDTTVTETGYGTGMVYDNNVAGGYTVYANVEDTKDDYPARVLPVDWTAKVTYSAPGGVTGTAPDDDTDYSYGATVTVYDTLPFTKDGYVQTGWSLASNDTTVVTSFAISGDTTLYPVFARQFTDSGVSSDISLTYGETITGINLSDYLQFVDTNIGTDGQFTFILADGSELPAGLTLIDGVIIGTPTAATTSAQSVSFIVTDNTPYIMLASLGSTPAIVSATLTLTFTVNKASQSISYSVDPMSVHINDAAFINDLTVTTVDGTGTITYASDDETVAKVNAKTGEVTIVGEGTALITATAVGTDNYEKASATYTLIVTGHTAGEAVKENEVAPTCTEAGSYDTVVYCTECKAEISRETIAVPATGHTAGEAVTESKVEATCTEAGSYDTVVYCTECGAEISRETTVVSATGHTAGEEVIENKVEATCTEDGSYDTVVYCTECGAEISRETIVIPAKGHTAGAEVIENKVEVTCTKDGSYDTVVYCSVCGDEISRETTVVPATGHTAGEEVIENKVEATCTEDGSYDTVVYCTECGAEISRETTVIPATGHTMGEEVIENTVEATCTKDGSYDTVVYCTVCGAEISRETTVVAATGHTSGEEVIENTVEATCTKDGSYDTVVYCTVCGAEISRETTVVAATGHTSGEEVIENKVEATCTEDGSYDAVVYCTVCGEELSRETIVVPATGHSFGEWEEIASSTCEGEGSERRTCTVCGYVETRYEDAAGHDWEDEYTVDQEPTCTTDGSRSIHCKNCDAVKDSETIPALGHTEGEAVIENEVQATCTEAGSYDTVVYCKVCGDELSRVTITVPAKGHDFGEVTYTWSSDGLTCTATRICKTDTSHTEQATATVTGAETKAATCTEKGETTYTAVFAEAWAEMQTKTIADIPALGHDFSGSFDAWDENGHWHICNRNGCTATDEPEAHSFTNYVYDEGTATWTSEGTETAICDADGCGHTHTRVAGSTLPDDTAPTGEITVGLNRFKDFINTITFGIFCKDKYDVTITAEDGETGIASIEYLLSETEISEADIASAEGWQTYEGKFAIEDEGKYIIYAKITDNAGNIVYISTDGLVVDRTNPEVSGIEDGGIYCGEVEASVYDEYLATVTVDGVEQTLTDGKFTVYPAEKEQTITVTDRAGNSVSYTVTVRAEHTWDSGEVTNAATCTEAGEMTYTCTICGETKTEAIPATGHTAGEAVIENEAEATCTKDGSYDTVVYCTVCGEELSRETTVVPATGHTSGEAVIENKVEATCTEAGSYDTVVYCTECGAEISRETTVVPATGHTSGKAVTENKVEATCTEEGSYDTVVYCTECGAEISRETTVVPATGHSFGEWEEIVSSTCEGNGSERRTCTVCGYVETRNVDASGHDWEDEYTVDQEPTCTTDGSRSIHCKNCDAVKDSETIPALGHTAGEAVIENEVQATCTEAGSYDTVVYCKVCGDELSRVTTTVQALGHTAGEAMIENKVEATCTEAGSYDTVVYCKVCGEELSRETTTVPATGHDFGEVTYTWSNDGSTCTATRVCKTDTSHVEQATATVTGAESKAATCTEKGETTYMAVFAEAWAKTQTKTIADIPALGHDFSGSFDAWDENGHWHICNRDGCTATDEPEAHSFTNYVYDEGTATWTSEGTETAICDADGCGHIHTRTADGSELPDNTAPTGEITVGLNRFKDFINTITFGIFCKDKYDVTITAEDGETGIASIEYLLSETEISEADIASAEGWQTYEGKFAIEDEGKYIIYVKITDNAGNIVYISTDGLVVDKTNPQVSGIEDGGIYCGAVEASVYDEYLATVTVDGVEQALMDGKFTVYPAEKEQTITVTDRAGNSVSYTVTVRTEHTWDSGEVTKAATCTEAGEMTYTCTICGETKTEIIPATGHMAGEAVIENEVEATCTEEGSYDTVVYCTVCGEELSRETTTIPALGHTAGEAVIENEVEATCTKDGSYDVVTYCAVCGEELSRETTTIPAKGHTAGEVVIENEEKATCTEDGSYDTVVYCTVCGAEISRETTVIPATGHSFGEWEEVVSPTCEDKGSERHTCTVCGYVETRDLDATGHDWEDDYTVDQEPSCTTDGSRSIHCKNCDAVKDSETIPPTGHTAGEAVIENEVEATCTEEGSYDVVAYCTVCGEEVSRETTTIPALGHTAGEAVTENEVEATCTEEGSYDIVVYCMICGVELSRETVTVSAVGHSYGEPVWNWNSDHTEAWAIFTCEHDASHTETVTATITVIENELEILYTATVTLDGQTWTDERTVTPEETTTEETTTEETTTPEETTVPEETTTPEETTATDETTTVEETTATPLNAEEETTATGGSSSVTGDISVGIWIMILFASGTLVVCIFWFGKKREEA